jgi:hypothetical protein
LPTKIDAFHPLLNANVLFFAGFLWISPSLWPNSGFWCCVFLTLRTTLICKRNLLSLCNFCFYNVLRICSRLNVNEIFIDHWYDILMRL